MQSDVLRKDVEARKASFGILALLTSSLISLGHSVGIVYHANFLIYERKLWYLKDNGDSCFDKKIFGQMGMQSWDATV